MIRRKVTIINKLGLHARAAAKLVHLASKFESESKLIRDNKVANGKSIMGVMMLAASRGTHVELVLDGKDEKEAITAICELIENRFGEAD